ncbi:MAG: DUF5668 domain-containing protein [Clostridia bacterium]
MKKNCQSIIWGLGFIIAGIFLFLDFTNIINVNFFDYFWPAVLIFIGITSLVNSRRNIFSYLLIVVGIFLIVKNIVGFSFNFLYLIPIALVVVGISFFISMITTKPLKVNPSGNAIVVFGGRSDKSFTDDFKGMNINCVFGGYEIDLREHKFVSDMTFNVFTAFGGTDIFVPKNVNIRVNPTAIFGGIDNKTENKNENEFTVTINAFCVFGGVDIANVKKN